MSRPMKDSGVEWIGEIPDDWEISKIKYVASINDDTLSEKTPADFEFNYVDIGSVTLAKGIEKSERFKFGSAPSRARRIVQNHDIIVSTVRTYLKAISSINDAQGIIVSTGFAVIRPRNIYSNFLGYFLKSDVFTERVKQYSTGVSYPSINASQLKNFKIILPSYQEQQKIAAFLDEKTAQIDSIIDNTKQSIVEFKKYKQALITETVTKGLNLDVKMKDSGIEWIGEIPENWEMNKMKRLGSVRNGLTYSPDDLVDEENGTLVLRSGNIQNAKLSFNDTAYVSRTISDSLYVKKGDILICSRNGSRSLIGKNAIIDTDMKASFGAFMMLFRTEELSKYIYYILNSEVFNFYLGTFLTATINQLTKNNFDNMNVVFCTNPEEQQQIVAYLDEKCAHIDSLIADKEKLIREVEDYKKALIYEYVTGQQEVE